MPNPWETAAGKNPWEVAAVSSKKIPSKPPVDYSPLESAGYGTAQGASFGFAPAIGGAAETAYGAVTTPGPYDLLENYRKNRDTLKGKFEEARAANPKSYLGGQVAGSIATSMVPGLNVAKAGSLIGGFGRAAVQGAAMGLGESNADLTKGEFIPAAEDTAKGFGLGLAAHGVLTGGGAVLKNAASIPKKALNVMMGVPEEATQRYMANPTQVMNSPTTKEFTGQVLDYVGKMKNDVIAGSQASRDILAKEGQNFTGQEVSQIFQNKIDNILHRSEGVLEPQDQSTIKYLESLRDSYAGIDKVSGNRLKDTLQKIDRVTDWEAAPGQFIKVDDATKQEARRGIDDLLKTASPAYREKMAEVANNAGILDTVANKFSNPESVNNLLNRIRRGRAPFAEEDLSLLDQQSGTNFVEGLKDSLAREAFDKAATNGSRNVNLWRQVGQDVGQKVPIPGMGTVGGLIGGTIDKYGPRIGKGIIDTGMEVQNSLQQLPGSQSVYDAATGLGGIMSQVPLNAPLTQYMVQPKGAQTAQNPWVLMPKQ